MTTNKTLGTDEVIQCVPLNFRHARQATRIIYVVFGWRRRDTKQVEKTYNYSFRTREEAIEFAQDFTNSIWNTKIIEVKF